jgi:hypothetical protein
MNAPYTETIRGEVSMFRGGAGGLSYVSRGPFNGAIHTGASWAEAVAVTASDARQMIEGPKTLGHFMWSYVVLFEGVERCANEAIPSL